MNTGKSRGNESVLVAQVRGTIFPLEFENKSAKKIEEEAIV